MASGMKKLFINYRQADSLATASRLFSGLTHHLAPGQVFQDTESIDSGEPWANRLAHEVHSADVLLVLIGRSWLTVRFPDEQGGQRRIDAERDWVRYEIESAIQRTKEEKCIVVPVLLDDAPRPTAAALPPSIRGLLDFQGRKLRSTPSQDWERDVEALVDWLVELGFARAGGGRAAQPGGSSVASTSTAAPVSRGIGEVQAAAELLGGSDPVAAERALNDLQAHGVACVEKVLALGNLHGSRGERRRARLFQHLHREATPLLLEAIERGDWAQKLTASYSFPLDQAKGELYRLIGHVDFDVARNAIVAVGRAGHWTLQTDIQSEARRTSYHCDKLASYVLEALVALAESSGEEFGGSNHRRRYALADCSRFLASGLPHDGNRGPSYDQIIARQFHLLTPRVADALVTEWAAHESPRIRSLAAEALMGLRLGRTTGALAKLAHDADPGVRSQACQALATIGGSLCHQHVRSAFEAHEPSSGVWIALARTLVFDQKDRGPLHRHWQQLWPDLAARMWVLHAFGFFDESFEKVEESATAQEDYLRVAAAFAAGISHNARARPLLERLQREAGSTFERIAVLCGLVLQGRLDLAPNLHAELCEPKFNGAQMYYEHRRLVVNALAKAHGSGSEITMAWARELSVDASQAEAELRQLHNQGQP